MDLNMKDLSYYVGPVEATQTNFWSISDITSDVDASNCWHCLFGQQDSYRCL